MNYPHKNIRLKPEHYKGQGWYFVTLCCAERRRIFDSPKEAFWVIDELGRAASRRGFGVYAYSVMPDHLHALAHGAAVTSDLLKFMKDFKQTTAYHFERSHHAVLWQKKYYEHILRTKESVDSVAAYIWMNPVRKGLCKSPEEYPFSGSMIIEWKPIRPCEELWTPPWKAKAPT